MSKLGSRPRLPGLLLIKFNASVGPLEAPSVLSYASSSPRQDRVRPSLVISAMGEVSSDASSASARGPALRVIGGVVDRSDSLRAPPVDA